MTHNLLMPLFDKVDLVEQDPKFVDTARKTLPEDRVPRVRFERVVILVGHRLSSSWAGALVSIGRLYCAAGRGSMVLTQAIIWGPSRYRRSAVGCKTLRRSRDATI